MSTPAVTPTPEQITVNTPIEQINAAIDAVKNAPAATPEVTPAAAEPTPYTVTKNPDGTVAVKVLEAEWKGKPEEIIEKLAKGVYDNKTWGKGLEDQLKKAAPTPTPAVETPAATTTPEVDPVQQYMMDTLAVGLGFKDAAEMKAFVGESRQDGGTRKAQQVAHEFHRLCPDFPATPEAEAAIIKVLEEENVLPTPQNLRRVHLQLVADKAYVPLSQDQITAKTQNGRPAPVVVASSSPVTPTVKEITVNSSWDEINRAIQEARTAGR
jgi:hypothetical protein